MYSGKLFGECEVRCRVMARDFLDAHPDELKGRYVADVFRAMPAHALGLTRVKAIGDALANDPKDEAWVGTALAYAVRAGFLRSRHDQDGRVWEVRYERRV